MYILMSLMIIYVHIEPYFIIAITTTDYYSWAGPCPGHGPSPSL